MVLVCQMFACVCTDVFMSHVLTETLEEDFNALQVIGLSCLGIGVSIFFMVGFICLFYYQRNRIGHYNFSVNPKQENFTSLALNT